MNPSDYFCKPRTTAQKQYCALTAFFKDGLSAQAVAQQYGYTLSAFYSLVRNFRKQFQNSNQKDPFFQTTPLGRKAVKEKSTLEKLALALRERNFSNIQIVETLKLIGLQISTATLWRLFKGMRIQKLPRRSKKNQIMSDQSIVKILKHFKRENKKNKNVQDSLFNPNSRR